MWPFSQKTKNPYGQYAGLVEQMKMQRDALFVKYTLSPETLLTGHSLHEASFDALQNALADCKQCMATEYPETYEPDGSYRPQTLADEIRLEIQRRYESNK